MLSTSKATKRFIAAVIAMFLLAAVPVNSYADSIFTDTRSHWAEPYINRAAADKLALGYPDGTFKPNKSISESEFLAMLLRSYEVVQASEAYDIANNSGLPWHYSYYNYAYKRNWPLTFDNTADYRRGQAAMLMASSASGKALTETEAIQWLIDEKLSTGRTAATIAGFDRDGTLTRAEALTFLYKLAEHTAELQSQPLHSNDDRSTIGIHDTLDKLLTAAAKPDRIDSTEYSYSWYIYNNRYDHFQLYGVENGRVVALFTNAANTIARPLGINIGMTLTEAKSIIVNQQKSITKPDYYQYTISGICTTLFIDKHDNDTIIGIQQQLASSIQAKVHSSSLQEPYKQLLFDLANAERTRRGIHALTWDEPISKIAAAHSKDMAERLFFSHTNPDDQSPFDRMRDAGIKYSLASENIAYGYQNPIFAHFALMNSTTGHRKSILNSKLSFLGTGIAFNETLTPYYTQSFYTK